MQRHIAWQVLAGACVGVGGACADVDVDITLAEIPDRTLIVRTGPVGSSERVVELLGGDLLHAYPDCPIVDASLAGTFGGQPMEVVTRGGKERDAVGGETCAPPRLVLRGDPALSSTQVEVRDHSLMVTATFATPDDLALRSAALRSHSSWSVRVGDTVVLDWTPASDLVDARPGLELDGARYSASVTDREVSFVVPDVTATRARIELGSVPGAIATACANARGCVVLQERFYEHAIEIAP